MDRTQTLFVKVNPPEHVITRETARAQRLGISEYVRHLIRRDAEIVLGPAKVRKIFEETAPKA
jgi:hypothetical protein